MSAAKPTLDDVLESFLLDRDGEATVGRYAALYPHYAVALFDLEHELQRELVDDPLPLTEALQGLVDDALKRAKEIWPADALGARDLFAALTPLDYGLLSAALGVPRQVVAAVRNRRAIPETIPVGFLRRMAESLKGSVEDLLASMGSSRSAVAAYKATGDVAAQEPVPFEQILIEARVSPERRAEIMADQG